MVRTLPIVAVLVLGFALRVAAPWPRVFLGDHIQLQETDAWHHKRMIDLTVRHFPHRGNFDPYGALPGGLHVTMAPLYDLLVAGAARVIGLGSPSQRIVDLVIVWSPVVLGVGAIFVAWLLARRLWNDMAASAAALTMVSVPVVFPLETRLGFADHHALEVFTSACVLLAFARFAASGRNLWRDGLVPGAALAAYIFTWTGAALVVGMLGLWMALEFLREDRPPRRPLIVAFAMALAVTAPLGGVLWIGYTRVATAGLLGLALVWDAPRRRRWGMAVAGGIALVGLAWFGGGEVAYRLAPSGTMTTVYELRSPLYYEGRVTPMAFLAEWGFALLFAPIGWAVYTRRMFVGSTSAGRLVWFWSTLFFIASLKQYRMGVYAAVGVALMAGYAVGCLWEGRRRLVLASASALLLGAANFAIAYDAASVNVAPDESMREALTWLRTSTPEPLGIFDRIVPREGFRYPSSAWSVMNWWDAGYWITTLAHRIPVSNPTQQHAAESGRFYTATDVDEARAALRRHSSRYIWFDHLQAIEGDQAAQFLGFVVWSGRRIEDYILILARRNADGGFERVVAFPEAYYRSMFSRIYLHRARGWPGIGPVEVFQIRETVDNGRKRREIVDSARFENYQQASRYAGSTPGAIMACSDPSTSCFPLEALDDFERVFRSQARLKRHDDDWVGAAEIYRWKGE